jgi:hypothetical protein
MAEPSQITSSNIIALWQLIMIAKRNNSIAVSAAIDISINSGLIGGDVPAGEGLKLGLYCKLLVIDKEQNLNHTDFCRDNLFSLCDTNEPNILIIRAILLKYMSLQNYDWLLFFNDDPEVFKTGVPLEWVDLLNNATLFDFEDAQVRTWWAEVFDRYETYKEGKKLEQGKIAEKHTFDSEKARLKADGFDNDLKFVKWASQISDKYGYDVLSVRGSLLKSTFSEKEKIQIEVKCTAAANMEEFRFYVSKPEWKAALENIDSYYFYCWVDTNLQKQTAQGPYIIPAKDLISHIPKDDHSTICDWSECRFILNLNGMRIN